MVFYVVVYPFISMLLALLLVFIYTKGIEYMKELFIEDSTKRLRYSSGNLIVENVSGIKELEMSLDQIDTINVMGNPQLSTQLIKTMSLRKKPIHFYSINGKYISSLYTNYEDNYVKQWNQFEATANLEFRLEIAKRIIQNKIALQEQLVISHNRDELIEQYELDNFKNYRYGVSKAESINQILGFEGKAAKNYYYYLSMLVPREFKFNGRKKRPPKDPFNSMISFGYDILYGYLRGALTKYGLNIGIGLVHSNRAHHAALASDLMEVWRPIIVDEVVMNLINDEAITFEMFDIKKNESVYLNKDGRRIFLSNLRERMNQKHTYFRQSDKRFHFTHSVNQQVESLMRAYTDQNPKLYQAIGVNDNEII